MTNLTTSNVFQTPEPRPETPMDKITHTVWGIVDAETERRQLKTAGLRQARLEKEADAALQSDRANN